jgi:hypothetical protein
VDLAPDRQGRAPQFEAVAARYDLAVRTTGLFTADADVPGLKASRRFNREAFRLDKDDPERYFSDAVTDEDVVFVLAAHQRHEAYQPAFTNVMDVAVYIARSNAMHEAFLAKAGTIADAARAGVASQQTFAVSLKAFGLSVTTNLTFSPYAAMSEKTWHAETLVPAVMPLSAGEVSKPLPIEGGALIACVAKRTEGDAVEAELLRPQLVASIDRYRAGVMFGEWASHIMRSDAGFKDLNAAPAASSTNAGADAEAP